MESKSIWYSGTTFEIMPEGRVIKALFADNIDIQTVKL